MSVLSYLYTAVKVRRAEVSQTHSECIDSRRKRLISHTVNALNTEGKQKPSSYHQIVHVLQSDVKFLHKQCLFGYFLVQQAGNTHLTGVVSFRNQKCTGLNLLRNRFLMWIREKGPGKTGTICRSCQVKQAGHMTDSEEQLKHTAGTSQGKKENNLPLFCTMLLTILYLKEGEGLPGQAAGHCWTNRLTHTLQHTTRSKQTSQKSALSCNPLY